MYFVLVFIVFFNYLNRNLGSSLNLQKFDWRTARTGRFLKNYDSDGDDLFPPEDIVHLMDEYTLAICEEEQIVAEWED